MSRKAQRRKKYTIQIIGLIVAVCVVIGISFVFQTWWNGRPGTAPQEVAVSVSIGGGESTKVLPYLVCEPGTECPQGELTPLPITDADSVDISVPKDIYDHDWAVLAIYDDPAANSETYHGAYEAETASIKLVGSDGHLVTLSAGARASREPAGWIRPRNQQRLNACGLNALQRLAGALHNPGDIGLRAQHIVAAAVERDHGRFQGDRRLQLFLQNRAHFSAADREVCVLHWFAGCIRETLREQPRPAAGGSVWSLISNALAEAVADCDIADPGLGCGTAQVIAHTLSIFRSP